jgi:hypothetical protein
VDLVIECANAAVDPFHSTVPQKKLGIARRPLVSRLQTRAHDHNIAEFMLGGSWAKNNISQTEPNVSFWVRNEWQITGQAC